MKKKSSLILGIIICFAAICFTSCSKERKLNKRLDGDWNLISYDGSALSHTEVWTFKKSSTGNGTIKSIETYIPSGGATYTSTHTGTYVLTKDETIAIDWDNGDDTFVITEYSRKDLTLVEGGSLTLVFKKK